VPLGGGSGASAACLAGKGIKPELEVIAVQASGAPAFYNSWKSGRLQTTERADTFAEGLATRVAYELSLQLLGSVLDDVVLVSDQEIEQAMIALLRHAHLLTEAAGAASTAAVSRPELRARLASKRVALVISGANVTAETLQRVLNAHLS
jgi:threonine dehydratase